MQLQWLSGRLSRLGVGQAKARLHGSLGIYGGYFIQPLFSSPAFDMRVGTGSGAEAGRMAA